MRSPRRHSAQPLALGAAGIVALWAGCTAPVDSAAASPTAAVSSPAPSLAPSPRRMVGRILSVDLPRGLALVELPTPTVAPPAPGTHVLVRDDDLRDTGELQVTATRQGRILGAWIIRGRPEAGHEVVWSAPANVDAASPAPAR